MAKERARGVTLKLLDPVALQEAAVRIISAQFGDLAGDNPLGDWKVPDNLALGFDRNKQVGRQAVVICPEGVSRLPDERGMVSIDLIRPFNMFNAWFDIYGDCLRDMTTSKRVDLVDHVRTFGDRLEKNFWLQYDALGGKAETVWRGGPGR